MVIVRSKDLFRINRTIWECIGLTRAHPKKFQFIYFTWILVFHISVTIFYPLHLIIGLFSVQTKDDIFKNLAINFSDILCSIKLAILYYNKINIWLIEDTFTTLDARIQTHGEKAYFQQIVRHCKWISYLVCTIYSSASLTSELAAVIADERRLLFPGWLPFDWASSPIKYWIANLYQFSGVSLHAITAYANDTYPPVSLAVLSGHLRLLSMRMSKLGTDSSKSQKDNNEELRMCILDHQKLIKIYYILSETLSKGLFLQIISTGFDMCCVIIYLVFYADSIFSILYYSVFLMVMPLQIFPSCYFGTVFEIEFNDLPYALFSCNWIAQDKEFKQNAQIISQRGLQKTSFICMGLFKLHLDTFYVTMKSAYSLFTVILQAK